MLSLPVNESQRGESIADDRQLSIVLLTSQPVVEVCYSLKLSAAEGDHRELSETNQGRATERVRETTATRLVSATSGARSFRCSCACGGVPARASQLLDVDGSGGLTSVEFGIGMRQLVRKRRG